MADKEDILSTPSIRDIITASGLGMKDFAGKYHIPKRTVEDWVYGKRNPPGYVLELLEYRISKELEDLKKGKT